MKALVLSSGGVDSTTCVGIAVKKYGAENVSTVSVIYGQKHSKELDCAEKVAKYYGVAHYTLNLTEIFAKSNCSLLQGSTQEIAHDSYAEQIARDGIVSTYVPFRNGLMLAAVASFAMSIYPNDKCVVYLGAHADDAAGNAYADCSKAFTDTMTRAIEIGTYERVTVDAPLVNMTKAEVVKTGLDLEVPYKLTWSCYEGGEKPCGKCATCIDRKKAFELNGVKDPALEE